MVEFKAPKTTEPTKNATEKPVDMTLPEKPVYRASIAYKGGMITGSSPFRFQKDGKWIEVKASFKTNGLRTFEGNTRLPADFILAIMDAKEDQAAREILKIMIAAEARKL